MAFGDSFLQELEAIDWSLLRAADAVRLRNALKDAVAKSDLWFEELANGFVARPGNHPPPAPPSYPAPGKGPVPPAALPSPVAKRGRGRPKGAKTGQKTRALPPLAVGGADAATAVAPQPARLFRDSYVSKDGPRSDVPAALPPDHPRRGMMRESSVTAEIDAADFHEVEQQLNSGKRVQDIFQVR